MQSAAIEASAILSPELPAAPDPLRAAITAAWARDEAEHVHELLAVARRPHPAWGDDDRSAIQATAADLVRRVRARAQDQGAIEAFMRQYDLGSEEGVLLMCVAEALLRIPDQETADKLIRDKLGDADWKRHMGQSDSVLVNASTWGLMLTGKLVDLADDTKRDVHNAFKRLMGRVGEPVIRLAVRQAMRIMGHQFVMGRTIDEALARSRKGDNAHYRYSFDMLGEGALTTKDALRYLEAYRMAIHAIGRSGANGHFRDADVFAAPSISVKLSALHPRYEHAKRARVFAELGPRLLELSQLAKQYGIGLTIDAEETDRLEMSLDLIFRVLGDASLQGWHGFGIVVQAYQKRAPFVIDFIADQARKLGRRIPVRLVKGAYWDSEVKRAQVDGQTGYPVFTRKANTDVSYQACACRLLAATDAIYPMFATHNAQTIAAIHRMASVLLPSSASGRGAGSEGEGERQSSAAKGYEFQKLHGMGDDLYAEVIPPDRLDVPCRVYAPVGSHEDLLPYLVRRLLENGANSSFVNRITDETVSIDDLIRDPIETVSAFDSIPHPRIPQPVDLFRSFIALDPSNDRDNSMGLNLANDAQLRALADQVNAAGASDWSAAPLVPGASPSGAKIAVTNPADRRRIVGHWQAADSATVERALQNAIAAQPAWDATPAASRAAILEHAAKLLEARMPQYIALCTKEAGKTISDGVAEVREAVDFLRYYAGQARKHFAPEALPGPTGESNTLQLAGRGVFVCISPWNFPLAIFMGQVAAALAAGNSVIAKPAEQTNLIGYAAVKLLHEAGVPEAAVQFLPGDGATVGAALTRDPRVAGVAFTGSNDTARDQSRHGGARRRDRRAHRRNRRPERTDRRFLGAAGAVGQGRAVVGLHFRRPALLRRARAVRAGRHRRQSRAHAGRRDGRTHGRRPGPAVHRRRPGDRRRCAEAARRPCREDGERRETHRHRRDRQQRRARHLLRTARLGTAIALAAHPRKLRPRPSRHSLEGRRARPSHRHHQRHRLRPHPRHPLAHRRNHRPHRQARQGRQHLRQPQPDRRRRRCAALRRPEPLRHRPQSRRPALPAALRDRKDRHREYDGGGRECFVVDVGGLTVHAIHARTFNPRRHRDLARVAAVLCAGLTSTT
jgi:RHH-type transcriptional regulator, proline utilization regulon repressor / proline dehydrogenase / delta 1-pyrroline-5-carboxylate dehydrogenase